MLHVTPEAVTAATSRRRRPAPVGCEPPDPIFAAIAAHRAALLAYRAAISAYAKHERRIFDSTAPSSPERRAERDAPDVRAALEAQLAADRSDEAAWRTLMRTRPTTVPGLLALARYVARHAEEYGAGEAALRAFARDVGRLVVA